MSTSIPTSHPYLNKGFVDKGNAWDIARRQKKWTGSGAAWVFITFRFVLLRSFVFFIFFTAKGAGIHSGKRKKNEKNALGEE